MLCSIACCATLGSRAPAPAEVPGQEGLSISYRYFPGAADDEESWSRGLTPQLMWAHLRTLLAAGPGGIEAAAEQLVAQQRREQQHAATAAREEPCEAAAAAAEVAPAANRPGIEQPPPQQQQRGFKQPGTACVQGAAAAVARAHPTYAVAASPSVAAQGSSAAPAALQALPQQPTAGGLHCLLPQGCRPAQPASVQRMGAGIFLLGSTGLAVSSSAAAAAPMVWQHADAVLHLGAHPLAGMQHEPEQQQQQQQAEAVHGTQPNGRPAGAAACRYCWLPVRCAKQDRHSLQQQLPAALQFAAAQLEHGRRLLVCCDSGLDASVCGTLACLLAFYRLDLRPGGGAGLSYMGPAAAAAAAAAGGHIPSSGGSSRDEPSSNCGGSSGSDSGGGTAQGAPCFPPVVGQSGFSKLAVRQHLAALSAHYPAARPTRGSIKQVFNFFLCQLGEGAAQEG